MEEVEILDLNEDEKNEKDKKNNLNNNNKKKKKGKRKLSKKEKKFLLINIIVILVIIVFYAYRFVHYYKLTHEVVENVTLKDKLTALNNLSYQNDGLHEKNGYFYYKGMDVDNYVYYSGKLFRIIDIDNGIRMIDDEALTNLVWGMSGKYNESNIYTWLTDYLNSLKDYEVYLKENDWCNESIDVENYQCNEKIKSYVGLISTSDYLQAGGKNSYLNSETYYWTINSDKDGKALYINNEGGINNLSSNEDNYFSYGIRPVITLKEEISIVDGDGTKTNPYVIENLGKAMLRDNGVGSYVKYNNQDFRIMKIEDDGITLIYNGVIEVEKNYNDAIKYLNNDYLKDFNKEDLVKIEYSVSEYNYANKYDYKSSGSNNSNYVTMPKVGDMFFSEYTGYWLNNIADNKLGLYYTVDEHKMLFADLKGNKHNLRPVIKLNSEMVVVSGTGTSTDPLMVGDNDVKED